MEEVSEYTVAERKWYQDVSLEDADNFILANMKSAVRSVIAIGYYLKCIRDGKMYIEAGYESIYDYAKAKYGFSKSNAHRYMERNDKFSVEGNSPILAEEYREFSKSQLQEMLSLDEELLSKVTPDMTVKEIREMKRPERREIPHFGIPGQISISDFPDMLGEEAFSPQENAAVETAVCAEDNSFTIMPEELFPDAAKMQQNEEMRCENSNEGELLSAYGTPRRIYPPGSLIATPGCTSEFGHGFDCFSCHLECEIRGAECYCVEAPMGNPFPCEMIGNAKSLWETVGSRCQFVNLDLAYHKAGSGEPVPCCKDCSNPCMYKCSRSGVIATSQPKIETETEGEEVVEVFEEQQEEIKEYDRYILEELIEDVQEMLKIMEEYWKENQPRNYTRCRMQLDAYLLLLKTREEILDEL